MATLVGAHSATTSNLVLDEAVDLVPGTLIRLEDELVEFRSYQTSKRSRSRVILTELVVNRGVLGTTPATHAEGTDLLAATRAVTVSEDLAPPLPFAGDLSFTVVRGEDGGSGEAGTGANLVGGSADEGTFSGGEVNADGAAADGHGGARIIGGGGSDFAGQVGVTGKNVATGDGGDISLVPGELSGGGRNGLIFAYRLPSTDPEVEGALFTDGAPGPGDPKALMVSGGPAA